ncbi:MAG TPA: hypothetical protein VGJ05_10655 [Fimbriiglobus sp.]|jgi:hypothetical protein
MSMKLLACLLTAALVTTGGAYFYHGSSSCGSCPLSGACPKPLVSDDTSTCPAATPSCCKPDASSLAAATCCEAKADPATAAFGGAISAAQGLK